MTSSSSKTFPATLPSLHAILAWATSLLEREGLSLIERKKIELALEEAVINIIHYSYPSTEGTIELIYSFSETGWVSFTLKDRGRPFDPTTKQRSFDAEDLPIEQRKIGGLGIPFLYALLDDIEYRREAKTNVLVLKKNIHS